MQRMAAAACLSPINSILRVLGGGGGRNWPSVEKESTVRLLPGRQNERRDSRGKGEGGGVDMWAREGCGQGRRARL
jgi:hypothetical protein